MFTVNNQYEIGQDVYLITSKNKLMERKCPCDMCFGTGRITYKGYNMQCPRCKGEGDILLNSTHVLVNEVVEAVCRIISYRYTVAKDGNILRYKIRIGDRVKNVPEDVIYATREEAIDACKKLNAKL